jgi:ABC-type arginine transport system permease subunit
LLAAIAFGLIISGVAWMVAAKGPTLVEGSIPLTVFAYLPRLLVISIAFYALAVSVRNYRAHRHNHVVNQHRAVAVKTFTVFAMAATAQTVRDAILAQAANTIFTSQPSGYGSDQAELSPQVTAVELIQRIAGK